jgi:hypothetical protein
MGLTSRESRNMRIALGIAIAVWTLAAWGGRIGLLTSEEGFDAWIRIGGSLLIGLFAAATLLIPQLEGVRKPALVLFSLFTVVLWVRSMIVNWTGSGSLPFKLVHTILAIGFFVLAWWSFAYATTSGSDAVSGPDEAHGQQQGESEAAGLTEG